MGLFDNFKKAEVRSIENPSATFTAFLLIETTCPPIILVNSKKGDTLAKKI